MSTKTLYVCDECKEIILSPLNGFVIQGNVYVADPTCRGGVIGNNFPDKDMFSMDDVKETVLCKPCLQKVLIR